VGEDPHGRKHWKIVVLLPFGLWLCCGLAWLDARCPPKQLYHSPFSTGHERNKYEKPLWVEIRTESNHSPIILMGKTDSTWGN